MIKFLRKLSLCLVAACSIITVHAQTAGTLTFTFSEVSKTPTYNGNSQHVLAVWVQTNAGGFVKTKLRYAGGGTSDHLPTWSVNAGGTAGNCLAASANTVDGTTGATRSSWTTYSTTWDGKIGPTATGTLQPDGVYKVSIQSTWNHGTGGTATTSYTFTKGPTSFSQTITGDPNYGNILLHWVPAAAPTPTPNFNFTSPVCVGANVSLLNASTGATSYTWTMTGGTPATSNATNAAVSYASPGTYSITLLASSGTSSATITKTISVITGPTITVTSPTICSGNSTILSASGANSYSWSSGPNTNTISVSPLTTTVYTVTGSNGTCSSVQTVTVFVNSGPTITVNTPTICPSFAAVLSASGATSYTWSSGPNTASITASPSVTTVYTATGATAGCSTIKTATIFVSPSPTVSVNNQTICAGGTSTVLAGGATTYSWSTGFNGNPLIVSPTATTIYTVTGTSSGCTNTKTVSVTIGTSLSVLISASSSSVCSGGSSTLTASGASNYTWNPSGSNATSITVNPTSNTTYTLLGKSGTCSGTTTLAIAIIPTPSFAISTSPSNSICAGKTVTLAASGYYTNYTWSSPTAVGSTYTASPTANTTYSVLGTGPGGCNTNSVVTITVKSNPSTALTHTNATCSNPCSGSVNGVTTAGTGPYSYSLSANTCTSLPCSSLCAGAYTLQTSDAPGCKSSATFSIFAPINNMLGTTTVTNSSCGTCSTGIANVNVVGGTPPYAYAWSPNGGNAATAVNLAPGCYAVTVTDSSGCSISDSACVAFTAGLKDIQINYEAILVYPNPAQNNVTVEYQGASFNYAIYNNLGQLMTYNSNIQTKTTVNLAGFSNGIYLLEVEIGSHKIRKKLIIE